MRIRVNGEVGMIDALCFMLALMLGLICLVLGFALLIVAGGAVARFYEWIKCDVMGRDDE